MAQHSWEIVETLEGTHEKRCKLCFYDYEFGHDLPCPRGEPESIESGQAGTQMNYWERQNYEYAKKNHEHAHRNYELTQKCARLEEKLAAVVIEKNRSLTIAKDLAKSLAQKYPAIPEWEPQPDVPGLLSQIENMVVGFIAQRNEVQRQLLKIQHQLKNESESVVKLRKRLFDEIDKNGGNKPTTLNQYASQSHADNAHWWRDPLTGEPLDRNVGELLCMVHSEVSEAMEGHRKRCPDEHLPHRSMFEVELADALIRIFDLAGEKALDLEGAYQEKRLYNSVRADHTTEARLAPGGKKY